MRHRSLLRTAVTVAVLLGAAVFVTANSASVAAALAGLRRAAPAPLLVGLALSGIAIANRAAANRSAHLAVGLDVPAGSLVRPASIGFAADKVVPSGGASGIGVLVRHGTRRGYPHGSVLAACLLARAASFVALGLLLLASVATLLLGGHLSAWWLAVSIGFIVYALLAGTLAVALARRRDLAQRLWSRLLRRAPRLARAVGSDPIGEMGTALGETRANRHWLHRTLSHAVAAKLLGAGMLLAAALAAGVPLGVTGALIAYSTALLASMASITPGGVGTVEASTMAILVSAGAGIGAAALAVALFRIFDLWLPVVVGALLARESRTRRATLPQRPAERAPVFAACPPRPLQHAPVLATCLELPLRRTPVLATCLELPLRRTPVLATCPEAIAS